MSDLASGLEQKLQWEYQEVSKNFRALAETRFKLLAFIPSLGGVAVYLLGSLSVAADAGAQFLIAVISFLGFLATLGIVFYDQRNSELYDALIGRAKFLETQMSLPPNPRSQVEAEGFRGQFLERPGRGKKLFGFIKIGHDTGLALIYGPVLGAWFFPMAVAALRASGLAGRYDYHVGLLVAVVMVVTFIFSLIALDPKFRRRPPAGSRGDQ